MEVQNEAENRECHFATIRSSCNDGEERHRVCVAEIKSASEKKCAAREKDTLPSCVETFSRPDRRISRIYNIRETHATTKRAAWDTRHRVPRVGLHSVSFHFLSLRSPPQPRSHRHAIWPLRRTVAMCTFILHRLEARTGRTAGQPSFDESQK